MDKIKSHMFNKIKSHMFRGRRYTIQWRPLSRSEKRQMKTDAIASCDGPPSVKRNITIDPSISEQELLRAAIDEGIHACVWDFDNTAVDEMAESISRFLWRLGFRLVKANDKSDI